MVQKSNASGQQKDADEKCGGYPPVRRRLQIEATPETQPDPIPSKCSLHWIPEAAYIFHAFAQLGGYARLIVQRSDRCQAGRTRVDPRQRRPCRPSLRVKFLDKVKRPDKDGQPRASIMNRIPRQAFVVAAILAFLTVSTAALAHGHPDANSVNESRCVMCMAAHGATHLIASPVLALHFSPIQVGTLVFGEHIRFIHLLRLATQGRAPPLG
jgi:hypothetical protein